MPAFAVVPHLGVARRIRAGLARMAIGLATMLTASPRLHASLAAAFLHQLFKRREALAFGVADLLAYVAALQREAARLSTTWGVLRAVHALAGLLAATACLGHWLQARRAVTEVTAEWARMAARLRPLARPVASRRQLAALHGRIGLGDSTGAEERLS